MSGVNEALFAWLPVYGPWLLFTLAVLETCFVAGLAVPSGVATSVATILALRGEMALVPVLIAATAGGAVGDSVGFWIGRFGGERLVRGRGVLSRSTAARMDRMSGILSRRPAYSVTFARLISFVRTLMPMAAGMSGLSYPRFVAYDLVGVVGWVGLYAGLGIVAGESWELLTQLVGVGGALIFLGIAYALLSTARRGWGRGSRGPSPSPGPPAAETEEDVC